MKLMFEDPFAGDHIRLGRTGNKVPGMIVQEGSVFLFHSPAPVRVGEGVAAGTRNR
jgi:hypothetical protein